MSLSVARVLADCLLKQADGLCGISCIQSLPALQVEFLSLGIDGADAGKPRPFLRRHFDPDLICNSLSDLALQGENIVQIAEVVVGPEMMVGPGVDQLSSNSDLIVDAQHRPFH